MVQGGRQDRNGETPGKDSGWGRPSLSLIRKGSGGEIAGSVLPQGRAAGLPGLGV